ncbi:hypothetical protein P171DRAFT_383558, partial [Karstenula rhodostoma CBS 690.94]
MQRLRFADQGDREYRIADAHAQTFRWIFEPPRDPTKPIMNFKEWLEKDGNHIYWITGKAGAGKSTLMKFITQQSRCGPLLRYWAGPMSLVTTRFYFWNSGSHMQMSQEGFLRTILHDALEQRPDMIPTVLPDRWTRIETFGTDAHPWLCLFIDGLDEFEGDLEALINLFRNLTTSPNVKACLASRPWNIFEDAFDTRPSLRLEHLTHLDIRDYVTNKLHSHSGFKGLARREPLFAAKLIENITTKSSGVFLWVYLTVKSLLIGFTNGDRVSDLQLRLNKIPGDLILFYRKIFASIEPTYTKHAYQLFHLIEAGQGNLTAMELYYADQGLEEAELIESAAAAQILPLSDQEYNDRYETINKRLNSRWKGLFEIKANKPGIEVKVSYLHRTARDFLCSTEVSTRM